MPIGVILNALAVLLGGCIGALAHRRIGEGFRENMNLTLGCCAMTIGVSGIMVMENMPAVIFSVTIGTAVGLAVHLGSGIRRCAGWAQACLPKQIAGMGAEEGGEGLLTAIVLFCASGTGIYGALVSGMTGDHSILLAKSVLDVFTAAIFACTLGWSVCLISVPQCLIFLALFFLAGPIAQTAAPGMICDFKAAGGVIMLATGLRIAKIKEMPVADMLPAMVLVMPASRLWTECVQPWILRHVGG